MKKLRFLCVFTFLPMFIFSQQTASTPKNSAIRESIVKYLNEKKSDWKLSDEDIRNWGIDSKSTQAKTGITYVYIHQNIKEIRIFNAVSSVLIKEGKVISFAKRFYPNASSLANTFSASLTSSRAIEKAAEHLGLKMDGEPQLISTHKSLNRYYFTPCGISSDKIRVELVFQPVGQKLLLAYDVNIHLIDKSHWWNVRIDAVTGEFLKKNDWVAHCDFGIPSQTPALVAPSNLSTVTGPLNQAASAPSYRVFKLPIESPSFGAAALLPDPSDPVASPFGWHDTDGIPGAEYTITRGNNVYAYDDIANQNAPGTSPNGGVNLLFDYPINFSQAPGNYLNASLTNLFYVNNMMHDMLYHNGFDEASGNFQEKNYSGQGAGQDYVFAECQDGGGTNNANFSTPDDGQNPTMQMYLWSSPVQSTFTVNSPGSVAGNYSCVAAGFGPGVTSAITANLVIVDDGTGVTSDACDPIVNGSALSGKIVLIDRGICNFVDKVIAAQNQGARAVLMINNTAGAIFSMGDNGNGGSVTIPSLMISQADGTLLKNTITGGATINATLNPPPSTAVDLDGSLDNGIVMHEFTHGVSNRLTGGPLNSNCLANGEQGGEGWSDFFALMFTTRPGDTGAHARGMGTYVLGQPNSGAGIRNYPYSTDMNINPETYGFLAQSQEVHDIGEVWCSVLWDLNWALISQNGFDPDWYQGASGNNITLKLVLEGMKLQPCGPGFLDSRDAILSADDNLYSGIHKCLIWQTFARRGMGYDALQGDPNVAGDETEGFALPPACLIPTSKPSANFVAKITSSCFGTINFTDSSTNIPQSWNWNFGDGDTSALQNPVHTYTSSGIFSVTLKVTNTIGEDSLVRTNYININYPVSPTASGDTVICSGTFTTLTANAQPGNDVDWFDSNDSLLFTGTIYNTPALTSNTTYRIKQFAQTPIKKVGPISNSIGTGGYHNSSFEGKLLFTTFVPVRLKSVWVDASNTASRTFNLYNSNGQLLQSKTIPVTAGQSRVQLNFEIQITGNYQIGVSAVTNLYRNTAGASYPYTQNGLVSITGSNSTSNPTAFYYYLYDWEVQEIPCISLAKDVTVSISSPVSDYNFSSNGLSVQFTNAAIGNINTYSWNFGNNTLSSLPNPFVTYAQPGTYPVTLTVTDAEGCQADTTLNINVQNTGIYEINNNPVSIFTNRNMLSVVFKTAPAKANIQIYDPIGKLLYHEDFSNGTQFTRELKNISSEFIMVKVDDGEKIFSKKVVYVN